jgi:hypothetical protein
MMSQYESNPYASSQSQPPALGANRRTSGLAVTALVLGIIGLVPCLGVCLAPLGLLLGIIAAAITGPTAPKKGRGLAIAAVIISVLGVGKEVYIWTSAHGFGTRILEFFGGYATFVHDGPGPALTAGSSGDTAAFLASFEDDTISDARATLFLNELNRRYGTFQSAQFDQNQQQTQTGQPRVPFKYKLQFANQTVDCETELVFADESAQTFSDAFIKKIGYIKIIDPTNGDITFPEDYPAASGAMEGTPPDASDGAGAGEPSDDDGN